MNNKNKNQAITRLLPIIIVVVVVLVGGAAWFMMQSPSDSPSNAGDFPVSAAVVIPTAIPGTDLKGAIKEAEDYLERNPKLATALNELMMVYQEEGQEAALKLAREKEFIDDEGNLRVVLVLDVDDSSEEGQLTIQSLVNQLEAKGAIIEGTLFDEVTLLIPVELAVSQAEEQGVDSLLDGLTQLEHVKHVRLPTLFYNQNDGVIGEGVAVTEADEWHDAGIRGQGIKVGIIDVGFFGYQEQLGEGLPDNVHLEPDYFERLFNDEVHGAAVAEIIHEMAPDAELYFGIGYFPQALNDTALWMAENGVQIINYSVGGSYGPFDGTSVDARIVDQITERDILWVNSAGNEAEAHWSGTFTDSNGDGFHEFSPGEQLLPILGGFQGTLSWWEGNRDADYDLCFFDREGEELLGCSAETQAPGAGIDPVETAQIEPDTYYQLAIQLYGDDSTGSPLEIYVTKGLIHPDHTVAEQSLVTPADARGSLTVGAAYWQNDELMSYSSHGPTGDGRAKPDISAPTHVKSVAYPDSQGFGGTSAAAPHVAGAAAVVLSAFPDMSRNELANYLIENSLDLGPDGYDLGYGEGRLALGEPPSAGAPPPAGKPPTPAPSVMAGAFIDDFSDSSSGLPPKASDAGWSSGYKNGKYVMTANFAPFGTSWELYQNQDLSDFTLNVEAQRVDGSLTDYYGIVFHVKDNKNYYVFQMTDIGLASLKRFTNGSLQSLTGLRSANVKNGQPNLITVEARGREITILVNGEEFHSLNNNRIRSGTIGFIVSNSGIPMTAAFDNLSVEP
jgi:subtilisin family serine protease